MGGVGELDSENLQVVIVTNTDPVRLRGRPLNVVDLAVGRVGQDGVLYGSWHLLNVPDQGLMIVT